MLGRLCLVSSPALSSPVQSSPVQPCPVQPSLVQSSQSVFPLRGSFCLFVCFIILNKSPLTSCIWVLVLFHPLNPDTICTMKRCLIDFAPFDWIWAESIYFRIFPCSVDLSYPVRFCYLPLKQWVVQFDNKKCYLSNYVLLMCTPTTNLNLPLQ